MRPCPRSFYGPDDCTLPDDDPEEIEAKINADIAAWHEEFAALPWWHRLLIRIGIDC
jgi:hypothetical protein